MAAGHGKASIRGEKSEDLPDARAVANTVEDAVTHRNEK